MKLVKQKRLLPGLGGSGGGGGQVGRVLVVRAVVSFYLLSGEDPQFGDLRHDTIT